LLKERGAFTLQTHFELRLSEELYPTLVNLNHCSNKRRILRSSSEIQRHLPFCRIYLHRHALFRRDLDVYYPFVICSAALFCTHHRHCLT
jgi:hypothetical protein